MTTTRDELRQIAQDAADKAAKQAAEAAVNSCFLKLGIVSDDPESVVQFQRDLQDLRGMATFFREARNKGAMAVGLAVLMALVGCVWLGIKAQLK